MRDSLGHCRARTLWLAVAVGLVTGASARAQNITDDSLLDEEVGSEISEINLGNFSFEFGADVVTEYWFRGISQGRNNTKGFIPQIYMDTTVEVFENVALVFGSWNSFTSSSSGGGSSGWYEADIYAGFSFGLPADLSMNVVYVLLYGPEGGSEFAQEIDLTLAWDDAAITQEQLGLPFSFQPYVLFAFEVSGASDGVGSGNGGYVEFGIEPSFVLVESETYPISIAFPMVVGGSLYDYYEPGNDFFGYFDGGVVLSVPLSFVPPEFGAWEASAGVHALVLGDDARAISRAAGTGGDRVQIIGTVGVSVSY